MEIQLFPVIIYCSHKHFFLQNIFCHHLLYKKDKKYRDLDLETFIDIVQLPGQ